MNIKKIISEEINDFEWAEEIPLPHIGVGDKIQHKNDVGTKHDGMHIITIERIEGDEVWFDIYRSGSLSALQSQLERGTYVRIRPDNINESDFEWANDIPSAITLPNEWGATYTVITVDKVFELIHHFKQNGFDMIRNGVDLLDNNGFIDRLMRNEGGVRFYITGRTHIDGWDNVGTNSRPGLRGVTV